MCKYKKKERSRNFSLIFLPCNAHKLVFWNYCLMWRQQMMGLFFDITNSWGRRLTLLGFKSLILYCWLNKKITQQSLNCWVMVRMLIRDLLNTSKNRRRHYIFSNEQERLYVVSWFTVKTNLLRKARLTVNVGRAWLLALKMPFNR